MCGVKITIGARRPVPIIHLSTGSTASQIGEVVSGTQSPVAGNRDRDGLRAPEFAAPGTAIEIECAKTLSGFRSAKNQF